MNKIGSYKNGNYNVTIFNDGTKIRFTEDDEFFPNFAESCDVQISNRCYRNCPYCYANCTPDGKIADFSKWKFLNYLHPYTEMALNLQFPIQFGFLKFLELLNHQNVIANITVNQKDFEDNYAFIYDLYERNLIHGIGISFIEPTEKFYELYKNIPNTVLHLICGVVAPEQLQKLYDKDYKVLFLGYKSIGRGTSYKALDSSNHIALNIKWIKDNMEEISKHFKVISFDNLALDQLDIKSHISKEKWDELYMGDDGQFTFYINLVDGTYARDSLSDIHYNIKETDTIDNMFKIIRGNNE